MLTSRDCFILLYVFPARGCLYNVKKDPSESHDLWLRGQKIISMIILRLRSLWAQVRRRGPTELNIDADPANHDYIWLTWLNNATQNSVNDKIAQLITKNYDPFNVAGCECVNSWQNFLCVIRSMLQ